MTAVHEAPSTSVAEALSALFGARSIAVVGASGDVSKLSGLALSNLLTCGYDGQVHAVNRRGITIDGIRTHRTVADIAQPLDAGIVMVPAEHAAQAVSDLGQLGARVAVVAVSGFAEIGTAEGRALQDDLVQAGRAAGVRIVGPNCNGIYDARRPLSLGYNYIHGLRLRSGGVALLSHSGAMAGSAVGLIEPFGAGLSHFVSCGNEADLALIDYAEFLLEDPAVSVFALILDSVGDGPRFRRFARRARDLGKAVLALKLGNSDRGRAATLAHSSRLSGPRAVYEAVFAEDGVALAPTLESLMVAAGLASMGRRSSRPGTIVGSTSGAGCIVMTDALDRVGVTLQGLTQETRAALAGTSRFAQVMNPFDLGASGSPNASSNVAVLAADARAGVLNFVATILQTETGQRRYAEAFAAAAAAHRDLAVLVTAPGPLTSWDVEAYLEAGIPVIPSTSEAANTIGVLQQLAIAALEAPPQTSRLSTGTRAPDVVATRVLREGRTPHEAEAKELLAAYGIQHPAERVVALDQLDEIADTLAYPVVVKGLSRDLPHKSEHGLVALGVRDAEELRRVASQITDRLEPLVPAGEEGSLLVADMAATGCEVIAGLVRDREFGMLLVVGPGGTGVELMRELHHVPLPTSAERLGAVLRQGVLGQLLAGYRGQPAADRGSLLELLLALAGAADALEPLVEAVELNPVLVGYGRKGGALALDVLLSPRTHHDTKTRTHHDTKRRSE